MIALAAENPSIQVTIKTKSQTAQRVDIMSVLQQHDLSLPNLRIVSGGDPTELIKDAHVVVGFNTTALLEALAAGKRVIFPRFSEATADALQPFILDLGNAVEYAESGDDLKQRIKSCLSKTEEVPFDLPVSTTAILKKWVGNDDGLASKRVLAAVKATLTQ